MTKLTILSDLHIDINKDYDFSALKDQEFVIIAGDIAGNPPQVKHFIENNISHGLFIEGNHLGYSKSGQYQIDFRQGAERWLRNEFKDSPVKYLENDIYEHEDVIFIGCTLWTDFELYGQNYKEDAINVAWTRMNDYNYIMCEHDEDLVKLFPRKTINWHIKSVNFIQKICKENPDKKIVIISHHAPSKKSIATQYRSSEVNPAYASDLEWLIEKYPNIKLWIHGHNHSNSNYNIGQCKVICNPFGYYNECNRDMEKFGQDKDCMGYIIDTKEL